MTNTSTSAMSHYIRNAFPKQSREHQFAIEKGSLTSEGAGGYAYIERSCYILAGKTQSIEKRVRVRIRVSSAGKLVFLQQFKKLD
jgi:hypothetical protein